MLKPQQVGKLHKNLLAVIDEPAPGTADFPARSGVNGINIEEIEVLTVAVVADKERRPRVDPVGQQHIAVNISPRGERREILVAQNRVVLRDEPQRQTVAELPVPFRPEDVIVKNTRPGRPTPHPR